VTHSGQFSVCFCANLHFHVVYRVTTLFQQWFSMTFPWPKNEFPWLIGTAYFFRNKRYITIHDLWMLTRKKIYFQLLVNQSVSKNSETTNRMIFTETKILVHFYKNSRTSSSFSMTLADFHDFPGLENGLTKFHDFPGRVVTLCRFRISWLVASTRLPRYKMSCWRAVLSLHYLEASLETNTHTPWIGAS